MPDYQNGKIYTIRCRTDDTLIYVGSTIQSLSKRWGGHKVKSKNEKCKNILIYRTINGNWEDWYIELYELYPCSCKEELCRREGEIIRLIGYLNVRIEGRTLNEYRENNKEKQAEYKKIYYENNKKKIAEQTKTYYENNKEEIAEKDKKYYENNKEKIAERSKKYYENNKEKKAERNKIYYQNRKKKKEELA
jgi:hypothetical protein